MPGRLPSLLVDSGPFVARRHPGDAHHARVTACLQDIEARKPFGNWHTVEGAVGEAYTLLRGEVGLASARAFLPAVGESRPLRVVPVAWQDVARFLAREPDARLGKGRSFVDASLVVKARQLGIRHVLTVNPADFRPFGLVPVP